LVCAFLAFVRHVFHLAIKQIKLQSWCKSPKVKVSVLPLNNMFFLLSSFSVCCLVLLGSRIHSYFMLYASHNNLWTTALRRLLICVTYWLIDWLICLIARLIDRLIGLLIDWSIDWMARFIDRAIDRLFDCSMDWSARSWHLCVRFLSRYQANQIADSCFRIMLPSQPVLFDVHHSWKPKYSK
jgi:hypothetical protein